MSEKNNLRIHAQIIPPQAQIHENTSKRRVLFRKLKKISVSTPEKEISSPDVRRKKHMKYKKRSRKLTAGDRLLRNSAIACAALLGILSLGNINQPWAQKASEGIEKALTMHIDLDDTIGDLTFVREIMPESALVFLNISGKTNLDKPISGEIAHPWNEIQPWIMFSCKPSSAVCAAQEGTVTAVSPLNDNTSGILIDHGNGLESVYAYLDKADVAPGDFVVRGQQIGLSRDNLYFEWRSGGQSIDPSGEMGL